MFLLLPNFSLRVNVEKKKSLKNVEVFCFYLNHKLLKSMRITLSEQLVRKAKG